MNFLEAVKAAQSGKKIKRKIWKYSYIKANLYGTHLITDDGESINDSIKNILAEDWEVVNEFTESDKRDLVGKLSHAIQTTIDLFWQHNSPESKETA